MTATIINGATPFGGITVNAVSNLIDAIKDIHRVRLAMVSAQAGAPDQGVALETGSNFGVVPGTTPGTKGADFAFALTVLDDALQSFLTTNQNVITALDNGK